MCSAGKAGTMKKYRMITIVAAGMLCFCGCKSTQISEEGTLEMSELSSFSEVSASGESEAEEALLPVWDRAEEQEETEDSLIYVQILGAVKYPGVYELPEGSRVFQVIEKAGGVTEDADCGILNQAQKVGDGQMIRILTREEAAAQKAAQEAAGQAVLPQEIVGQEQNNVQSGTASGASLEDDRVDLNTATKEQLMTLPGIGESKAQSIIAWRQDHGSFQKIEDLMEIEGIKEGVFSKIKDSVKVN